jgi:hypothetical protein
MKKSKIIILNQIIDAYPQFKKMSILYDEIVKVLECSLSEAKELAKTHCNMVSFWAILKASGKYDNGYSQFFKHCLRNKFCDEHGFISDKPGILKSLNIESELKTLRDYEDILDPATVLDPEKFYQVKIKADTSGDHFMVCYNEDGIMYLSDTSYRGIGVKATDFINGDNFQKISEVV